MKRIYEIFINDWVNGMEFVYFLVDVNWFLDCLLGNCWGKEVY
jgi:hypothetical protein